MSSAPNKQPDVKVQYNDQHGKWQVYKNGVVIFTGSMEDAVIISHYLTTEPPVKERPLLLLNGNLNYE
jgi:hypothetical protein